MANYYDHVLMFNSEAEAKSVLKNYVVDNNWVGFVIPNLIITLPNGYIIPGFFINIASENVEDTLIELPNNACRIVTDREAAKGTDNFFVYINPGVDLAVLSLATISPVFSGSEYPFCAS